MTIPEDLLISRVSNFVKRDNEGAKIRTLDPQVRTSKYAAWGEIRDRSAVQDDGERFDTTSFDEIERTSSSEGITSREQLVRAFAELADIGEDLELVDDYYSNPVFFAYERQNEAITGETQFDLLPLAEVVQATDRILDVGFGGGRVLDYIKANRLGGSLTGIDRSPPAFAATKSTFGDDVVDLRLGNAEDVLTDADEFDLITFLDASINVIPRRSNLNAFLGLLTKHLSDHGRIMLSMFDDASIPEIARRLDGLHVVHRFADDQGKPSLLWWAMEFDIDTAILHRTGFVDRSSANSRHLLLNIFDRFWTPTRLEPVFANLGLVETSRFAGEANGGALKGLPTVTIVIGKV